METILGMFDVLQAAVVKMNQEGGYDASHPWHHALTVGEKAGLLDVEYRGEYELWFDDRSTVTILEDLLCLLASPDVAPRLRTFTYRTDAVSAANGTYDYNIDPFIESDQQFPNLTCLSLDQGQEEHGYKILTSPLSGDDWLEAGVLARMLDKARRLEELTTPVPPNSDFFSGGRHSIRSLDVDSGFGQENFVRQLAGCTRFPELRWLVFTDYRQDHMTDWRRVTTSFEDYILFFESATAQRLEIIRLQEVSLSQSQIDHLLSIRSAGVTFTRFVDDGKP